MSVMACQLPPVGKVVFYPANERFSTAETVSLKEHKFAINDHGDEATITGRHGAQDQHR